MGNLSNRWSSRSAAITQDNIDPELTKGKINSTFYEVETRPNVYITKLCVILRTGRRVYIPYAHQPLIDFVPERDLQIITHQIKVTIQGRNLHPLMDALFCDTVRWIKESNVKMDDHGEDIFISRITIESTMLT